MLILHKDKADEVINLSSLDVFNMFITEKKNCYLPSSISLDLSIFVFSQVGLVSKLREVMRF